MKKFCLLSLAFLTLVLTSIPTTLAIPSNSSEPIKLGAVLILTGSEAMYGEAFREGIEIAVDEVNAQGGVNGQRIELIIEDSGNKPRASHTAAMKLLEHDKVVAALNSSFTEVMANGPAFERAKVPVITLWDTATEIEALGEYVFGIGIYTPSAGKKSAGFGYHNLKGRSVVIINMHNEWGDTVSRIFREEFTKLGGKILETFSLDPATTDFRTVITKAKKLNPDFLYTPMVEGVIPFYTQLKALGVKQPIVTSDIIADEHVSKAPAVFEGIYQTQALIPDSPRTQHLTKLFEKKFKRAPSMILFNAWGYDGIWLLVNAIKKAGVDPKKIKTALYTVKDWKGASGPISINREGSSPTMEQMFQIRNKEFVLVD